MAINRWSGGLRGGRYDCEFSYMEVGMIQAYKVAVTTIVVVILGLICIVLGKDSTKNDKTIAMIFAVAYIAAVVGMWV